MFQLTSRRVVFTLLIVLVSQGCSVNKRYHNTGFNIQWNWHTKSNTGSPKIGLGSKKHLENTVATATKEHNCPIDLKVTEVDAPSKTIVENRYTKAQNNTVHQSQQLYTDTAIKVTKVARNPSPTEKKSSSKHSGLASSIIGLVLNSTAFLSGVLIAATMGIGWGSVQGLIWILWILGCIPLLIVGLVFTISGMIKMSQASDEPSNKKLIINIASILAMLGVAILFLILLGS